MPSVGELTEKTVIGLRSSDFTGQMLLFARNHERVQALGNPCAGEVLSRLKTH